MTLHFASPKPLQFELTDLVIEAQAWGDPSGIPVLALHGWLDNSASFYRLAPLLKHTYIVALDMAGHGRSGHRRGLRPYNIWDDVGEIFAIANQLGWQQFALLGHSRGAIISTLCAGTFPGRISHLALIDGMLVQPMAGDMAAEQLANSVMDCQRPQIWPTYETQEQMVKARMTGVWPMSHSAAEALVLRGSVEVGTGFRWSSDPLLRAASAVRLTEEQQISFLNRITAPIKVFVAQEGALVRADAYGGVWDRCVPHGITGGHHCHMEEEVFEIAEALNSFFSPTV